MPTPLPTLLVLRQRRVTGRTVLVITTAFFAAVIAVNVVMAYLALSTLGGLKTPSAYKAGLAFAGDVAEARLQDARHWRVDGQIQRAASGAVVARLEPKSRDGAALTGLTVTLALEHPIDSRLDRSVPLTEEAPGRYGGTAELPPGLWDAVIDISRGGERLFHSENRLDLK